MDKTPGTLVVKLPSCFQLDLRPSLDRGHWLPQVALHWWPPFLTTSGGQQGHGGNDPLDAAILTEERAQQQQRGGQPLPWVRRRIDDLRGGGQWVVGAGCDAMAHAGVCVGLEPGLEVFQGWESPVSRQNQGFNSPKHANRQLRGT